MALPDGTRIVTMRELGPEIPRGTSGTVFGTTSWPFIRVEWDNGVRTPALVFETLLKDSIRVLHPLELLAEQAPEREA